MSSKRYNLINNSLGWLCFLIAAVSYVLTIEPTASFWDCPEFITQGSKLEVGHPPGNPIFMLTARFVITVMGVGPEWYSVAINVMNALLSAATILLLFWTITHLMRRLLTGYKDLGEITVPQQCVIFGAGLVGALAYAWSDTFWYSAVEGEVYAFSSFCTALVFWLILKWESRADQPHSDRYIILIAYVIGVSIAVHLLNLLCIPAIVLVFYYRKYAKPTAKGSIIALCVSFIIVALILFGLVPGFVEVAQYSELFFVNTLHMPYNSGVVVYTLLTLAAFIWTIRELYRQMSVLRIRLSFAMSVLMSGIPFIGSSLWIPVAVLIGLITWLFMASKLPVRILNVVTMSIFVIFIGYSSYALLLIRATANTPVNQNAPDNVFALGSYLNREQYGQAPLLYGNTFAVENGTKFTAEVKRDKDGGAVTKDEYTYGKAVPGADGEDKPHYVKIPKIPVQYEYVSAFKMFFPRLYDSRSAAGYMKWGNFTVADMEDVTYENYVYDPQLERTELRQIDRKKPTFAQNMSYFLNYQLIHMYFRYFMWNFAGRQNDLQGNGEVNRGNWISGIPAIDNARLGDQSLLPEEFGSGNKGHNVFYMLPLLLGLVGLIWQSCGKGETGIRQFWVVFFLFFMTGVAIVLYLNQTPNQPRERDYAFAGSFYAFAIWIGLGVGAVAAGINKIITRKLQDKRMRLGSAIAAGVLCMIVPLQMVSQTWDDHDRSGRYTARDFGMNYLASLEPNAVIFTFGDNDTFPLWYTQEVEGFRTDVRVINLSYLTTDWYAAQQLMPAYEADKVGMQATESDFGLDRRAQGYALTGFEANSRENIRYSFKQSNPGAAKLIDRLVDNFIQGDYMDAREYLKLYYSADADSLGNILGVGIPASPSVENVVISSSRPDDGDMIIRIADAAVLKHEGQPVLDLADAVVLDIISTSAANGWNRPIYFANTVPDSHYAGYYDYMHNTGMAQQVRPPKYSDGSDDADRRKANLIAYDNIVNRFRWGGLDAADADDVYLDETVQRMVYSTRNSIITTAENLLYDGETAKALELLELVDRVLVRKSAPYMLSEGQSMALLYNRLGRPERAKEILSGEIERFAESVKWLSEISESDFLTLSDADAAPMLIFTGRDVNKSPYSYFCDIVGNYISLAGGDEATKLLNRLSERYGVNCIAFYNFFGNFSDTWADQVARITEERDLALDRLEEEPGMTYKRYQVQGSAIVDKAKAQIGQLERDLTRQFMENRKAIFHPGAN